MTRRPSRWALAAFGISLALGFVGCSGSQSAAQRTAPLLAEQRPARSEGAEAPERSGPPTPFEATLLSYNLLFQYQQVASPDGSYPAWVCRAYPYVVDHPELHWVNRFPAITETIERADADILGLTEMRGDARRPPDIIGDMTRWMEGRYRWVSVRDVPAENIAIDPRTASEWPGPGCRGDMSQNDCASYDPATDAFTTLNYIAYRPERFELLDSGAFEVVTSLHQERRFAPWARLRDRASGSSLIVTVLHMDPSSGAHRVASAERLRAFVREMAPTPVAVMGDLNFAPNAQPDCDCPCEGDACSCPEAVVSACQDQSSYTILTAGAEPLLVDAQAAAGQGQASTTMRLSLSNQGGSWQSGPCWPRALARAGRPTLPELGPVERGRARKDYVFVSPSLEVLSGEVLEPSAPTIQVDGAARTVMASDHLPVRARVRVPAGP